MKRWIMIALLPLVLTACGATLRTHANVAVLSGEALAQTKAAIEGEREADRDAVYASNPGPEAEPLIERLIASWAPVERAYAITAATHNAYRDAIVSAVERGEKTLAPAAARSLLDAWVQVLEAAEPLGLPLPAPPGALVQLAGDDP